MGGAVYASLDGQANFAAVPERIEAAVRDALGAIAERVACATRKSDKLPSAGETVAARQLIRMSTTSQVGDHQVVRVHPYVRVAANLSLSLSELSANVPAFNPLHLVAKPGSDDATSGPADAEPDAEVSFVTRDLSAFLAHAKIASEPSANEMIARVRDVAAWFGTGSVRPSPIAAMPLAYAATGDSAVTIGGQADPYAGFEARIVPENITLLAKTASQTTGGNPGNERTVTARKGDSVKSILHDLGATPEEIKAIVTVLGPRGRDGGIKEGQKLRILLEPADMTQRLQPIRVMLLGDNGIEAAVALSDAGKYVDVDVQHVYTVAEAEDGVEEDDANAVRLYQSLYETGLRNRVPRAVIDDMIRIYAYDMDLQRRTLPGDSFELLYSGDADGGPDSRKDILFATLTVGGEARKYYRFQTPDDNVIDYYDESGRSAKKFLVRKPVPEAIMRSGFGMRRHPILGYVKMHTGVDWAAPNGTPIYAAGEGVVEKVGPESGYGKYVRLRHNNGYETAYGHLSGFARGLHAGARVHQGQVIGYVGSTGLATGAHCHFEIMVNGRFVDPMRIKLPRGRVLEGAILASFERERERLDGVLAAHPTHLVGETTAYARR